MDDELYTPGSEGEALLHRFSLKHPVLQALSLYRTHTVLSLLHPHLTDPSRASQPLGGLCC